MPNTQNQATNSVEQNCKKQYPNSMSTIKSRRLASIDLNRVKKPETNDKVQKRKIDFISQPPYEIVALIVTYLPRKQLSRYLNVCAKWRRRLLLLSPLWKNIVLDSNRSLVLMSLKIEQLDTKLLYDRQRHRAIAQSLVSFVKHVDVGIFVFACIYI
ncbi:hypothetical protein BDA99DRAFT_556173 [Phascolomyces articulosus]|uniref:F-box domain-containing protein n=1 Tax=Phascolomyces articulosus TaxID=60185 RepID=A0AAD5K8X4_9FUNG|nr:hypothetical protein BDA99DRAFT_556173 [Phascolomyces articulosus]